MRKRNIEAIGEAIEGALGENERLEETSKQRNIY